MLCLPSSADLFLDLFYGKYAILRKKKLLMFYFLGMHII